MNRLDTSTHKVFITMQDILFATFLFVTYFCCTCYFFYSPNSSSGQFTALSETDQSSPIDEVENLTLDLWDDEPITIAEALSIEFDPQPEHEIEMSDIRHQEQTLEELLEGIDLDTLQLRPARKICGRLGIQQKVNSKDAPLSWLRSQIKSRLSEEPTEVAPIIQEVLRAA